MYIPSDFRFPQFFHPPFKIWGHCNIVCAPVLSNSYCAIMNKIVMWARPCSIKWRARRSCKISDASIPSSFCSSFGNVKIILNNPNPSSSLWLLPGKDVHFNVSILTLFVYIFIEYLYSVCLRFHYNSFEDANFSWTILETSLNLFVRLLLNWLWRVRIYNKVLCFPSPCIVKDNCIVNEKWDMF